MPAHQYNSFSNASDARHSNRARNEKRAARSAHRSPRVDAGRGVTRIMTTARDADGSTCFGHSIED
jgi:uncharacterized membrane protein